MTSRRDKKGGARSVKITLAPKDFREKSRSTIQTEDDEKNQY
jgi:hypothetical protein